MDLNETSSAGVLATLTEFFADDELLGVCSRVTLIAPIRWVIALFQANLDAIWASIVFKSVLDLSRGVVGCYVSLYIYICRSICRIIRKLWTKSTFIGTPTEICHCRERASDPLIWHGKHVGRFLFRKKHFAQLGIHEDGRIYIYLSIYVCMYVCMYDEWWTYFLCNYANSSSRKHLNVHKLHPKLHWLKINSTYLFLGTHMLRNLNFNFLNSR